MAAEEWPKLIELKDASRLALDVGGGGGKGGLAASGGGELADTESRFSVSTFATKLSRSETRLFTNCFAFLRNFVLNSDNSR